MISGVLYALLAGLMWGLIFVGPLIVPEYPAMLQSMGRYLALGLIALPIAWLGRVRLRQLARRDWLTALMLTMMGNLIYYFCLASAIQRTGAPVSTMIIGTLPVVIPVFANLLYSQRDGKLAWGKLAPALICIGIGLASVNIAELNHGLPDFDWARYTSGIVLALVSVVCWAWYALRNARWLRENPDKHPMMWATAQALVTLPVSLIGYLLRPAQLPRRPQKGVRPLQGPPAALHPAPGQAPVIGPDVARVHRPQGLPHRIKAALGQKDLQLVHPVRHAPSSPSVSSSSCFQKSRLFTLGSQRRQSPPRPSSKRQAAA